MNRQRQAALLLMLGGAWQTWAATDPCPALLSYSAEPLQGGAPVDFCSAYRGKVILAVNTASQCGYTPQLKGLETLYQTYRARGLVVLGFPSGDFNQEHDNPADTARVAVSGARANGFFKALEQASGKAPQWNFQKYLIDRKGKVVTVFPAQVAPDDLLLRGAIEAALAE